MFPKISIYLSSYGTCSKNVNSYQTARNRYCVRNTCIITITGWQYALFLKKKRKPGHRAL